MITEITMYWLTRLDGIYNACGIVAFLSAMCGGFMWAFSIAAQLDQEDCWKLLRRFAWICTFLFFIAVAGVLFIPTTKEMAAIYAIPAISRSEVIHKDIPELYDSGIEYIKSKLQNKD